MTSVTLSRILYFVIPMVISFFLVPFVKKVAWKYGIFAVENKRTVHHGKIPRIGGVAVYIAFILGCAIFMRPMTAMFRAILLGGFVVFVGGLLDDIFNLKPWVKMAFQIVGALIVIFIGNVELREIHLFFGVTIPYSWFSYVITFFWLIGITNAINLLDGLDGLSSGFSIIVLLTICLLSTVVHNQSVIMAALLLAGSAAGFLFYNFHPASIFIGDCGAQFLGFMIASFSIMGFKGGTFITMLIPITLLFIPIMDTLSAMLRRKLSGHSFAEADQKHIHHTLMKTLGLGQMETVLIIYFMTIMFGFAAYMYAIKPKVGIWIILILIVLSDLLIESTGMISQHYHPLLKLIHKIKHMTLSLSGNKEEITEEGKDEKK